ncbi:MAG: hypothetical protein GX557_05655, partial [Chloroflexi bacterium]|nr:hypothetical protein [Chloroflexota bacterium]
IGSDEFSRTRLAAVHKALGHSEDPVTRIVYVATHADTPDSPVLVDAMRVRNPDVISFARALQAGLRTKSASAH